MDIKEKLTAELKNAKLGKYETEVKNAVLRTICKFCKQNAEFRQAIEQSGKSFADCLKATVKGAGASLEYLEVYKRAVAFYFPGADIKCTMTLDLGDGGFSNETSTEAEASSAAQQAKSLEKAKNALSQQIAALEAEIKELENRPVEVAVEPAKDGVMDKTAFDNICKTYEQQLDKVQEDALQDTIRLNREHTEQMNSLKAESEKKLEELRSQLEAAKREQSELTVSVPDSKETFKAYLATAIDAAKRLCEFIGNNSEDSNHDLFVAKAKQFFTKMTEEI